MRKTQWLAFALRNDDADDSREIQDVVAPQPSTILLLGEGLLYRSRLVRR
jgi:hypothetical protein